ncbi:RhtB family transporter [Streptococcus sanguinis]|uniref:RhtB family transporter n=1 Tax=Streptococcus sanguinis TaxID=1305 RepID=UPI0022852F0C|nr:RhtB family transporter [Streptococcus sanguinis]MCY7011988.1 RhtB family transporter [Streptococcus sanguinis]
MVAFVSYTYVYLVFVASVLPGLVDFLPVSEKKSLQGKAGTQFAASYLLAGALQSSAELASIKTMSS